VAVAALLAGGLDGAGLNVAGAAAAIAVPVAALAALRVLDHADDRTVAAAVRAAMEGRPSVMAHPPAAPARAVPDGARPAGVHLDGVHLDGGPAPHAATLGAGAAGPTVLDEPQVGAPPTAAAGDVLP